MGIFFTKIDKKSMVFLYKSWKVYFEWQNIQDMP